MSPPHPTSPPEDTHAPRRPGLGRRDPRPQHHRRHRHHHRPLVVHPRRGGITTTLARLAGHGDPGEPPIAIETSNGLLVERLLAGHPVVPIHPNAFSATRPRWGASRAKTDPGDSYKLADYLRTECHRLRRLAPPRRGLHRDVRVPSHAFGRTPRAWLRWRQGQRAAHHRERAGSAVGGPWQNQPSGYAPTTPVGVRAASPRCPLTPGNGTFGVPDKGLYVNNVSG